jgi:acetoacetyl-CoA reductase
MTQKRALVTGGTRGIGAATSKALKKHGYQVAAIYGSNDEAAKKFEAETGIKTFKCNIADFATVQETVAAVEKALGGNVEILVNNAGITRDSMLHKMTDNNWSEVIDTNLSSAFNTCRAIIEKMRDAKYGRIVNISSVNAYGCAGQTNYAAAKAGIIGFTKSLALEGARYGITANAIAPGYIDTEMVSSIAPEVLEKVIAKVPLGRLGKPEEIAELVCYLASDLAAYITGAVIDINGALRV